MANAKEIRHAYQNNKVITSLSHAIHPHGNLKKTIKTDQRPKCIANTSDKNMGAILCDLELGMTLAV